MRAYKTQEEISAMFPCVVMSTDSVVSRLNGIEIISVEELGSECYERELTDDDGAYEINTMYEADLGNGIRVQLFEDEIQTVNRRHSLE